MNWKPHDPSLGKTAKSGPVNDFKKLNKLVIKDGATEAKVRDRDFKSNESCLVTEVSTL